MCFPQVTVDQDSLERLEFSLQFFQPTAYARIVLLHLQLTYELKGFLIPRNLACLSSFFVSALAWRKHMSKVSIKLNCSVNIRFLDPFNDSKAFFSSCIM